MARSRIALVSALSLLLLGSCGGQVSSGSDNGAAAAETDALGNAGPADPLQPPAPAGNEAGTVPPPDAVSHPDGYLPDAADAPEPSGAEPAEAGSPGSKAPPPATEDEYIRDKQAGR